MLTAFIIFLMVSLIVGLAVVARELGKSQALMEEETDDLQGVIDAQKTAIKQDAIVNRNPDTQRMREKLSAALRRKPNP